MSQEKRFSDEFLSAFVDNQLAADEKARAYLDISQDEALNRQVCELRKLHDVVQMAYRDPPPAPARQNTQNTGARWRAGMAASVLLAIGAGIGITLQQTPDQPLAVAPAPHPAIDLQAIAPTPAVPVRTVAPASTGTGAPTAPGAITVVADGREAVFAHHLPVRSGPLATDATNKVLIHIAHDDNTRLGQALEEIEGLLRHYRDERLSAHVEVVINGRGLELVRPETSRHITQIARLQKEYDNVTFAACLNTIERLQREQGIHVRLLPGVVVIDSGMAEIMRRQIQGWAYLQV